MEENKTTLQRILEQKAEQIKDAIEQAINEGARVEPIQGGVRIDGKVIFVNEYNKMSSIVLDLKSDMIFAQYLKQQRVDLEIQKQEIEKKLKELEQ